MKVELANLWRVGSILFLYRPYMMLNSEELLFGTSTLQTSSAFTHSEVHRQCEIISSLLAANAEVVPPDEFVSFHLLYGCITVCAVVKNFTFQASYVAGETRSLLETPSRSKRKGVLNRYELEECENFFIDVSMYDFLLTIFSAL